MWLLFDVKTEVIFVPFFLTKGPYPFGEKKQFRYDGKKEEFCFYCAQVYIIILFISTCPIFELSIILTFPEHTTFAFL